MRVTAWNDGDWNVSGAGYGVLLTREDRDRFFHRAWTDVIIRLDADSDNVVPIFSSFWIDGVVRAQAIGKWMRSHGCRSWSRDEPPHLVLTHVEGRLFALYLDNGN